MTASSRTPTANEVRDAIKRIEKNLVELDDNYRWALSLGHGGSGSGEATRYGLGHVSDPTGTSVASKPQTDQRHEVRRAGVAILDASAQVAKARGALERAFATAATDNDSEDPGPRMVTKAELAEAEAAKRRRERRGEGWGQS